MTESIDTYESLLDEGALYAPLPEPTRRTLRIRTRALLCVDSAGGLARVVPGGELLVRDGMVLEAGESVSRAADETLDWSDSFVAPGFVDCNALGDIDHALVWCEQDRPEKLVWSEAYAAAGPVEAMTPEDEAMKSLFAYVQLLRRGVTSAVPITCTYYKAAGETYAEEAAAAKHAAHLGMRVWLGQGFNGGAHVWNEEERRQKALLLPDGGRAAFEEAKRFALDFSGYGGGLVTTMMAPERVELQDETVLQETAAFCRKHGMLLRLHAAQSGFEWDWTRERFGMTPVERLERLGLLSDSFLLPHALYTTGSRTTDLPGDSDLEILKARGVAVIHCPLIYARRGDALDSFPRYKAFGIRMAMGSDTFPPDPFMIMRTGAMFAQSRTGGDVSNCRFRDFWEAYTEGGADALHRPDLGRLAPGARADFVRVKLTNLWLGTVEDPIRTLCMCAAGTDVSDVWIDGRPVMEEGRLLGLDPRVLKVLQPRAEAWYAGMKASFEARSALASMRPFWQ